MCCARALALYWCCQAMLSDLDSHIPDFHMNNLGPIYVIFPNVSDNHYFLSKELKKYSFRSYYFTAVFVCAFLKAKVK